MSGVIQQFPVAKEYEKNPDISPEDIKKLRDWMKTQPHLPEAHISDLDLVLIYFCCEKSSEVSKQVLDLHFTLRTLFTTFFKDRDVDRAINDLKITLLTPLAAPSVHGYRAIYCRLLDSDPKRFIFADVVRTLMMVFDLWQYGEGTWPGFLILIDMDTSCLGHIAKVDMMSLRQVLYFLQESMLIKLRGVHFLNAPNFMDKVMMLLKPFLKKALLDMIRIHERGSDSVYEYITKESLPKESGGQYKDYLTLRDEMIRQLKDNTQYFKEEGRRRVNESLRKGEKKTVENLFGIQGSFKKLDID